MKVSDNKTIALDNTVFRVPMGSELYGVSTGSGDRDEMGICIEPPECVIGLAGFEQYQFRTQPDGVRSGPGDLDLTIYSLRKWAGLAAKGNPNMMLMLFVPEDEWVWPSFDWFGDELQSKKDLFISKDAGRRFLGYLDSQKKALLGERNKKTNRPELTELYGFDTKFAYHAIRLGIQGVELMTTGKINLPMSEPYRSTLIDLRQGAYSKEYALEWIENLEFSLSLATEQADIPDSADMIKVNQWLVRSYTNWWEGK